MDQDATWYEVRPRPRGHCAMGTQLSQLPKRAQPPILARVCCGQTDGRIKMPLGMEVGLGPGHNVFDTDPASPMERGIAAPLFGSCLLWPHGRPSQQLLSSCLLVHIIRHGRNFTSSSTLLRRSHVMKSLFPRLRFRSFEDTAGFIQLSGGQTATVRAAGVPCRCVHIK